jgi:hypothetical protein
MLFYDAAVALRVTRRLTFTNGDEVAGVLAEADQHVSQISDGRD